MAMVKLDASHNQQDKTKNYKFQQQNEKKLL